MSRPLTVGSLFSGVGGIDLAFEQAGATIAFQCEIDPQCQRVLRQRWPDIPIYDNVERLDGNDLPAVDVLVGGFPCQDVSLAGRRSGLDGKRSGLWFEFARLIAEIRPTWLLIENVPGLLSSNGGRDMGTVLGTLADLGYGYAYRVLDAQYAGLAQRRERVFIVGCLGDGARAAQVLLDAEGVYGDSPPSRPARQRFGDHSSSTVPSLTASGRGSARVGESRGQDPVLPIDAATGRYWDGGDLSDTLDVSMLVKGQMMPEKRRFPVVVEPAMTYRKSRRARSTEDYETWVEDETTNVLNVFDNASETRATTLIAEGVLGDISHTLTADGSDASEDRTGRGTPAVAFTERSRAQGRTLEYQEEVAYALTNPGSGGRTHSRQIMTPRLVVRRLTPTECLRLQGLPDDWLEVDGKPLADTPKYRMIGNSVAVPCVAWIARRMVALDRHDVA